MTKKAYKITHYAKSLYQQTTIAGKAELALKATSIK